MNRHMPTAAKAAPEVQGQGEPPLQLDPQTRTVLDAWPGYLLLVDETHRIVYANSAVAAAGLDVEAAIGGYCPKVMHDLDGPLPGCPLELAVRDRADGAAATLRDDKTGRSFHTRVDRTDLLTNDGKAIYLHTLADVTDELTARESFSDAEVALKGVRAELRRSLDAQIVISDILLLSLEDLPLGDLLSQVLERVFAVPWLALQAKGAIFVLGEQADTLVMAASKGMTEEQQEICRHIAFGYCLCGRAARSSVAVFAAHVGPDHDVAVPGAADHGHYCVPIRFAGRTLGVLNTYLEAGHPRDEVHLRFLETVAATLAGIVARRDADLAKAQLIEQLRHAQKMHAIGRLAGGVAHDFNNLLSVILGSGGFLAGAVRESPELGDEVHEIMQAARRAGELTSQLLALSRKDVVQPEILDLNVALVKIEKMLARMLGERIRLRRQDCRTEAWIRIDPRHLEQVVMNLAINARDAMPEGGLLEIETDTVTGAPEQGDWVRLRIRDNGIGMTPDVIERVFEPFFTTKVHGRGTGLGMAMVYGIVGQAGGDITVDSAPGSGTVVEIRLPRTTLSPPARKRERYSRSMAITRRATVLVVEDDSRLLRLIVRILTRKGMRVLAADGMASARRLFDEHGSNIDLLLSDIVLADGSGVELARALRAEMPKMGLVYMSGYARQDAKLLEELEAGVTLLAKPFEPNQLVSAINALLRPDQAAAVPQER